MILRRTLLNCDSYLYLERYVNSGSPSGFTDRFTTSTHTSAKSPTKHFQLYSVDLPDSMTVQDFGDPPKLLRHRQMFVHPDMIRDPLFSECLRVDSSALLVSPTASARTVKITGDDGWYLKLNYKGRIGRVDRQIGISEARSAIEVSRAIAHHASRGALPPTFHFLKEVFARVASLPTPGATAVYEWGLVVRESVPFPLNPAIVFLVPGFSLFARDERHPDHPTILAQLIEEQAKTPENFLFDDLLSPLFDAYFMLLLCGGLQLEAHAQNILFALDRNLIVVGVVARDAASIDKDISLMADLGLPNTFHASRSLHRGRENYQLVHSLMFDWKLGEYLVRPIIKEVSERFPLDVHRLRERLRARNRRYLDLLPPDFFPANGKWYSYANVLFDRNGPRPYVANPTPTYR